MILGLTGGIGCGKSTAARIFESHGFRRIDSDALVREVVLAMPEVRAAIRDRFGPEALLADGSVNRHIVAARVFTDDASRLWLQDLTHPHVLTLWRTALSSDPATDWVVEVPLLFEAGLENWFDFTVCVASAPTQQLARLEQRGLPRALAEQRISKQLPLAHKIELAYLVLWNDGTPEFLTAQIDRLIETLPVAR